MLSPREEAILEKVIENDTVSRIIDSIIARNFLFSGKGLNRIKRGLVHSKIANDLGLMLNNYLVLLIKERMIAKGAKDYISRGDLYYKNVSFRDSQ